jgi:hypothetical protein
MGNSKQKSGSRFSEIILLVCLIGLVISIANHNFIGPQRHGPIWERHLCIDNLRQIDSAINEWALEKGKTNGTIVTENDITNYIKLNRYGKIPPCPSGGKYTYGKVGDIPQISCSLSTANPPHVLP